MQQRHVSPHEVHLLGLEEVHRSEGPENIPQRRRLRPSVSGRVTRPEWGTHPGPEEGCPGYSPGPGPHSMKWTAEGQERLHRLQAPRPSSLALEAVLQKSVGRWGSWMIVWHPSTRAGPHESQTPHSTCMGFLGMTKCCYEMRWEQLHAIPASKPTHDRPGRPATWMTHCIVQHYMMKTNPAWWSLYEPGLVHYRSKSNT